MIGCMKGKSWPTAVFASAAFIDSTVKHGPPIFRMALLCLGSEPDAMRW